MLTGGHWTDADPDYSPNGNMIAFASNRGGYESAIWVMHSDGSGLHRLTAPNLEGFWPSWSPDGTHITFSTNCCRPTGTNIWVMRADGSDAHAVTHVGSDHNAGFPTYSPDGHRIVLQSDLRYTDRCCSALYVMNADGSHLHAIITKNPTILFSDWGPTR
jgi:TolB protein